MAYTWAWGFSQDFRIGCPKIHIWGEFGVRFLFIPLHYTQKIKDIRVSKISNRVSFGHPDTPLAKGLPDDNKPPSGSLNIVVTRWGAQINQSINQSKRY